MSDKIHCIPKEILANEAPKEIVNERIPQSSSVIKLNGLGMPENFDPESLNVNKSESLEEMEDKKRDSCDENTSISLVEDDNHIRESLEPTLVEKNQQDIQIDSDNQSNLIMHSKTSSEYKTEVDINPKQVDGEKKDVVNSENPLTPEEIVPETTCSLDLTSIHGSNQDIASEDANSIQFKPLETNHEQPTAADRKVSFESVDSVHSDDGAQDGKQGPVGKQEKSEELHLAAKTTIASDFDDDDFGDFDTANIDSVKPICSPDDPDPFGGSVAANAGSDDFAFDAFKTAPFPAGAQDIVCPQEEARKEEEDDDDDEFGEFTDFSSAAAPSQSSLSSDISSGPSLSSLNNILESVS